MTSVQRTSVDARAAGVPAPARMLGWLPDGTPRYASVGRLLADGDRVCCHLCGHWFLSVASHLRAHGWTKDGYLAAFGLEFGNPLAGAATHKRRSAALTARGVTESVIRQAQQAARERARTGQLAAAAAAAARGRPHPAQRRPKTLAALAAVSPETRAARTADRSRRQLEGVAAAAAAGLGFPDFTSYAVARLSAGASMADISREAGLHKDWVSRHLGCVAPAAAAARHHLQPDRRDARWVPVLARLGFDDLDGYLSTRHLEQHRTVASIAAETGTCRRSVESALRRHGIVPTPHTGARHAAARRDRAVAAAFGFDSLAAYVADRRAGGSTWSAMSAETGIPESTLARR